MSKRLEPSEIEERLAQLQGWKFVDNFIIKSFTFKDFKEAFSAMTRIAFECEKMNHHPNWENVYNTLVIKLNTHDAGGVTEKDFKLAQIIETILAS
ncbi:4a-hydroxytetrahydrobiopterin dehydratase [Flagellimonas olearia]|uniref:Putative pterin-4-alpha-carbinolamine dehydratase n=1 Tax=Flagellimonas olearia TaxID=552546 RepID=A0A6I1E293_9FLAO|nr:4a-hydroxytetrahydrobiopterin dehydratase [Allomuricauda olearia]KAB7530040.1 4a-hydroxytetrahydrobiopterin dehydratase [Allomuricauda olearia]